MVKNTQIRGTGSYRVRQVDGGQLSKSQEGGEKAYQGTGRVLLAGRRNVSLSGMEDRLLVRTVLLPVSWRVH